MLLSSILQKIKLLKSKGSMGFLLSLVALISMTPAAKAGQVLMESDRLLEYPYRWQGHRPRGESECLQGAAQELLGKINQMSNISAFDSFTNSETQKKLSDKFENIGDVISNTITYTDAQSSSGSLAATQRGLVVSVSTEGFKLGTFDSSSKKHFDNRRESACWGTLLYKFVIYGPDTITPKSSTSSSSSSSNTNISSEEHYFKITNNCDSPVSLSMTYTNMQGTLITDERNISPGESVRLTSSKNKWSYNVRETGYLGRGLAWGGRNGSPEPNILNTCSK